MAGQRNVEQLLECLIQVVGRAALSDERVRELVGKGEKQVRAFNLADGSKSQLQIAKATSIDQGQLSRTFQRWVENGIVFWIGDGKESRPLHIYPIPANSTARSNGKVRTKRNKRK